MRREKPRLIFCERLLILIQFQPTVQIARTAFKTPSNRSNAPPSVQKLFYCITRRLESQTVFFSISSSSFSRFSIILRQDFIYTRDICFNANLQNRPTQLLRIRMMKPVIQFQFFLPHLLTRPPRRSLLPFLRIPRLMLIFVEGVIKVADTLPKIGIDECLDMVRQVV